MPGMRTQLIEWEGWGAKRNFAFLILRKESLKEFIPTQGSAPHQEGNTMGNKSQYKSQQKMGLPAFKTIFFAFFGQFLDSFFQYLYDAPYIFLKWSTRTENGLYPI